MWPWRVVLQFLNHVSFRFCGVSRLQKCMNLSLKFTIIGFVEDFERCDTADERVFGVGYGHADTLNGRVGHEMVSKHVTE